MSTSVQETPAINLSQELYNLSETAELLRCSRPYVYTLIRQGKLHAFRVGTFTKAINTRIFD